MIKVCRKETEQFSNCWDPDRLTASSMVNSAIQERALRPVLSRACRSWSEDRSTTLKSRALILGEAGQESQATLTLAKARATSRAQTKPSLATGRLVDPKICCPACLAPGSRRTRIWTCSCSWVKPLPTRRSSTTCWSSTASIYGCWVRPPGSGWSP